MFPGLGSRVEEGKKKKKIDYTHWEYGSEHYYCQKMTKTLLLQSSNISERRGLVRTLTQSQFYRVRIAEFFLTLEEWHCQNGG